MKFKNLRNTALVMASIAGLIACSEFTDHSENQKTGTANFTKFYSVGNSITAGYQSSALYSDAQSHSFGAQIANKLGVSYYQPLVSGDGIGGRIKWSGAFTSGGSPIFSYASKAAGAPDHSRYATDNFNNLGIPGAIGVIPGTGGAYTDFFNVYVKADGSDGEVGASGSGVLRDNPFFGVVLANGARGNTLWKALKASQPTFVSLWLGNNDVLGYATSGGVKPSAPSSSAHFSAKFTAIVDSILSLSSAPKMVVLNTPDVTTIPFFTTVNPGVVAGLRKANFAAIYYQKSDLTSAIADTTSLKTYSNMITLTGSAYGSLIGTATGKPWRDVATAAKITVAQLFGAYGAAAPDTTKPFALHPQNPWPSLFMLDAAEKAIARAATEAINAEIYTIVTNASRSSKIALVDVYANFNQIAAATAVGSGVSYQGITVNTKFISGGLFSFDGVHPTNLGHGIIANYIIEKINQKFDASITPVPLKGLGGATISKIAVKSNQEINLDLLPPTAAYQSMIDMFSYGE